MIKQTLIISIVTVGLLSASQVSAYGTNETRIDTANASIANLERLIQIGVDECSITNLERTKLNWGVRRAQSQLNSMLADDKLSPSESDELLGGRVDATYQSIYRFRNNAYSRFNCTPQYENV